MDTQKLLFPSDAAAVLGLTPAQVHTLVRKGQLAHVALPNGELRFDLADLSVFIKGHKRPATTTEATQ